MKYTFLLAVAFLLTICSTFAQEQTDIVVEKKGLGTTFSYQGNKLTPKQLMEITRVNPEAYQEMKIAKTNHALGTVFSFAGGFLVGMPLGTAIGGGDPNWSLLGIGAGLIAVSIPFTSSYNKRASNAADIYNRGMGEAGLRKPDVRVGFSANRFSLKMTF